MRVLRAATGRNEMLSCFNDFHGKTYGAVSLAQIRSQVYGRVRMPGAHMVPRPDTYRPMWSKADGTIDTDRYLAFYDEYIEKGTVGDVAGFVLEPIQGWGGSVMPPDDFFPKLRKYCDAKRLLLMTDEVLTSWGRTGKWLCTEHWGVVPDVVAIGKGFGNGFPVTAVAVREPHAESFEKISASSSYGGNPMACAAALASTEVIQEENLLEHALHLGELALRRMERMKAEHPIVGDVRAKGCLMGIELVKDRATKDAFRQGGRAGLPEGLPQGPGLDPGRPHPADEPADRHGRRRPAQGPGPDRRGHRRDRKGVGMAIAMKRIRFGIIGCGLMGREFASAAARWCHLPEMDVRPEIVAVCDKDAEVLRWYTGHFPSIGQATRRLPCAAGQPRRSTPCTVPCRTICTRKSTRPRSVPASTCWAKNRSASTDGPTRRSWPARPSIRRSSCDAPRSFPSFPAVQRIGRMVEAGALRPDPRGQRRLPAFQRSRSPQADQLEARDRVQRRLTAAWATWGCTSATCRSAPVGCRGRCGRCCRTS